MHTGLLFGHDPGLGLGHAHISQALDKALGVEFGSFCFWFHETKDSSRDGICKSMLKRKEIFIPPPRVVTPAFGHIHIAGNAPGTFESLREKTGAEENASRAWPVKSGLWFVL